jgi:hypothetical protein
MALGVMRDDLSERDGAVTKAGGDEEQIRQMDVVLPARKFTQHVLNVFFRSSYV